MHEKFVVATLHKHWVAADSINHHLRQSLSSQKLDPNDATDPMAQLALQFSGFMALSGWYSLLYVVVEGYQEIGLHDQTVDELLSQTEYVDALRRFRNATFHYQEDPISKKLMGFLEAKESEVWIQRLNQALKNFFERELRLDDVLAAMRS